MEPGHFALVSGMSACETRAQSFGPFVFYPRASARLCTMFRKCMQTEWVAPWVGAVGGAVYDNVCA